MTDQAQGESTYKGFRAAYSFDPVDLVFAGRIAGINDVIGFHADTVSDLIAAFHEAVDDYLETCARMGKEPERTYSGKVMLRVDPGLHAHVALAAQLSGKSINQLGEEALRSAALRVVAEPKDSCDAH